VVCGWLARRWGIGCAVHKTGQRGAHKRVRWFWIQVTEERPLRYLLPSPVSLRRHVLASLSATRPWASSTGALVTNVGRDEGCGLAGSRWIFFSVKVGAHPHAFSLRLRHALVAI